MGRGANPATTSPPRPRAAVNFGEAARAAGVERVVYLAGSAAGPTPAHLRSRPEVAELLASGSRS